MLTVAVTVMTVAVTVMTVAVTVMTVAVTVMTAVTEMTETVTEAVTAPILKAPTVHQLLKESGFQAISEILRFTRFPRESQL